MEQRAGSQAKKGSRVLTKLTKAQTRGEGGVHTGREPSSWGGWGVGPPGAFGGGKAGEAGRPKGSQIFQGLDAT